MIGLVNLGSSNLQSVMNALEYLKIPYSVAENCKDLEKCDRIILPGVGSFGSGIKQLKDLKMIEPLHRMVELDAKPILGICLGMQLLFERSEESEGAEGLGLVRGNVERLTESERYKIPRIGWAESKLNFDFLGLKKDDRVDFYYLHSYHVRTNKADIVSIETEDGIVAAIKYKNIYGCQFHPEKSHKSGLKLLKMFAEC